ncbi:XK-related protein 8-like [Denticeps clupeoides]|uniref:XK-related protein n=1 Tax=Denticeps clupeoides TaxID=299321 RepID=A0AAY4E7R9_9TELE|nr:XK-related protein 8-like [Denticeps clupeoides]
MEELPFIYPASDCVWNLLGLGFCLADVVLDVLLVVEFYQEGAYACLGVMIFLLLLSSLLLQAFSFLWYNYGPTEQQRQLSSFVYIEKYLKNQSLLRTLHVLQLGIYFRFAAVLEISVRNLKAREPQKESVAVYLNHDLSMLRLIETFVESAPQLALMMCVMLLRDDLEIITGLKTAASLSAIAFSVLMYHRSLRSFLPNKANQDWSSSLVYFLWNLLLIGPRLGALALFASVEPCYTAAHFLVLWPVLVLWAWRQDTDFMDSQCGEWLYRATVGVIWYFSWFNVSAGSTRNKSIIYHSLMSVDTAVLLTVWFFKKEEPFRLGPVSAPLLLVVITSLYSLGIIVRIVYYGFFHPKDAIPAAKMISDEVDFRSRPEAHNNLRAAACMVYKGDSAHVVLDVQPAPTPPEPLKGPQKRMRRLVNNFYS